MIRSVAATRYAAPLREGGSLPGLVEADARLAAAEPDPEIQELMCDDAEATLERLFACLVRTPG